MSENTAPAGKPVEPMRNLVARDRLAVDVSLLVLRLVTASVFFVAGGMKMWGWWDGPGIMALSSPSPDGMGLLAWPVAIGEFFGSLGLIVGFLSRFSAASLIGIMIGAIVMAHGANGFMAEGGYWPHTVMIGALVPIVLAGPGRFAVMKYVPMPEKVRMFIE